MNLEQLQLYLSFIAIDIDTHGGSRPSGYIYAQIMGECSKRDYDKLLQFGIDRNLWTLDAHVVTLTPDGQKLADNIRQSIQGLESQ